VGHHPERPFEAKPLHKVGRRFSQKRLKHTMEMKRRESCGMGDIAQTQWFTQSIDDVIDRAIDSLDIRRRRGCARFFGGSQDLTNPLASLLSNETVFSGRNCGVSGGSRQ
jgi:hypothetical protein